VSEFAIATLASTQLELNSAKKTYRECAKDAGRSCEVEWPGCASCSTAQLACGYLDRYCMR